MGMPQSPTNGQQHQEGTQWMEYVAATNNWKKIPPPNATPTVAGPMSPADKAKLDTIESSAKDDQSAAEVTVTPTGNLTETDVQAALVRFQSDLDGVSGITAENVIVGTGGPDNAVGDDGDFYENFNTGDRYGPKTAGAWGPIIGNAYTQRPFGDATGSDTLAGDAGVDTNVARADHRHAQSRGPALPAADGSEGIDHFLVGHPTLADGPYWLNQHGHWVES